jgi:hypothetical protein
MHHPLYTLFGLCRPRSEVSGFVKAGYEPAREALEVLLQKGMEENVQVCVCECECECVSECVSV